MPQIKFFLISLLLLTPFSLQAQTANDSLTFKLNEYFSVLTDLKQFNGNVIVSNKDNALLNASYSINGSPDSLKVEKDSKFIIASVSKIFIKLSILKLNELNKLELEDKLTKFIPDFPNGDKITIEHLLFHKSGLPRELTGYENYDNLSIEKAIQLSKLETLQFEPGAKTLYSNVSYFLLHYIIDKASEEGYPEFTNKYILQPFGMYNTSEYNLASQPEKFAWGYINENSNITPISQSNINRFESGNYYSTTGDLFKLAQNLMSGNVVSGKSAIKMFNDSLLIQAGGRPGYRAYFYKNLKTGVDFIFLCNYSEVPFEQITKDVINIVGGKPYEIPKMINRTAIQLEEIILQKYTGKFSLQADISQYFTVSLKQGKLFLADKENNSLEIIPDSETTFFDNPSSSDSYIFELNEKTGKYILVFKSNGILYKTQRVE